jgi:hypothetical protein
LSQKRPFFTDFFRENIYVKNHNIGRGRFLTDLCTQAGSKFLTREWRRFAYIYELGTIFLTQVWNFLSRCKRCCEKPSYKILFLAHMYMYTRPVHTQVWNFLPR